MFISFDKIADNARVWVYQANRFLTDEETKTIMLRLSETMESWAAHGAGLLASVQVLENRFVFIATDESHNAASGCSIDTSVRWIQDLGKALNVDFLDRSVVFRDMDCIGSVPALQAKKAVLEGKIKKDTLIFDTTKIIHKKDLLHFETVASETWLKNYL